MNGVVKVVILSYLESHANCQFSHLVNAEPSHAILLWILLGVGTNHSHLSQSRLQAGQGEDYQEAGTPPEQQHFVQCAVMLCVCVI